MTSRFLVLEAAFVLSLALPLASCGGGADAPAARPSSPGVQTGTKSFALAALGQACTTGADCDSTFCADGVCCNEACGGGVDSDCQACSVAKGAAVDGTCQAKAADAEKRASGLRESKSKTPPGLS